MPADSQRIIRIRLPEEFPPNKKGLNPARPDQPLSEWLAEQIRNDPDVAREMRTFLSSKDGEIRIYSMGFPKGEAIIP